MAKKKTALPKTVAGLKVPKSVRKSRLLRGLLASPVGRQVAADALVAGAGAAATVLLRERKEIAHGAQAGLRKTGRGLGLVAEAAESALGAMTEVVGEAARAMLPQNKVKKKNRAPRGEALHH